MSAFLREPNENSINFLSQKTKVRAFGHILLLATYNQTRHPHSPTVRRIHAELRLSPKILSLTGTLIHAQTNHSCGG